MRHNVQVKQWKRNGQSIGLVGCNGVYCTGVVSGTSPDCEKLATIISLEKFLAIMESKPVKRVLPFPVEMVVAVLHQLVRFRYEQLKAPKGSSKAKSASASLKALQNSPNRWVRAIVAASQELLK